MNSTDYYIGIHRYRDLIVQMQRNDIQQWIPGQFVAIFSSMAPILQSDNQLFQFSYTKQMQCECGSALEQMSFNNLIGLNEESLLANSTLQAAVNEYMKQCEFSTCTV